MFHRESGVFKTTYSADMALYPLPIAKWTVAVLALIFVVIVPLTVHEYYLSILSVQRLDYNKAWQHLRITEKILDAREHKCKALRGLRDHLRRLSPEPS